MKAIIFGVLLFSTIACSQNSDRSHLGQKNAQDELAEALKNEGHNVVDNKSVIIKDSITAIHVAEPILFGIYGKDNIIKQRPYEVYHFNNYWVIMGTLPKQYHAGGTFLIIIDDRNGTILKITHGK